MLSSHPSRRSQMSRREGMEAEKHRRRPELGTCLAGKYEVERLLGEGSMGAVYAARNLTTGKNVAIKWLIAERETDFTLVDRFRREARAAGRVDHPNVVTIFDVGQHDNAVFLVMELLHGEPLSDILHRGRLDPDEVIGLMIPVMRGVAAAHAAGVVHRDLKPENVFFCRAPDGSLREPKVLDFGISKLVGDAALDELRATRTGVVIGTPTYMSPEQIAGTQEIDSRIDVYALGVMLYEMLAGRPPFVAGTYTALVVQIATVDPPDLRELRPDIDPELVSVIERAMKRDRDDRFADVESLARALEPFGTGTSFRPEAPSWSTRVGPSRVGSKKFTSTADGRAVVKARESVPTISAKAFESGLRETGQQAAAGPDSESPSASAEETSSTVLAETVESEHTRPTEDSFRVDTLGGRRRVVGIGALVGVALLAVGIAVGVAVNRDDASPEPTSVGAPVTEPDNPAEPESLAELEPPPGVVEPPSQEPVTEPVAEQEPSMVEGAGDETGPAAVEPERRRRTRRPAAMRAVAMTAEVEMSAEVPETMATMSSGTRHRAGTLSVDEF